MTAVNVFAPAKINLSLHVIGRRDDGYHLLDSLVAFARVGDRLRIQAGNTLALTVEGPEAQGVPADMGNLALRAAALVAGDRGAALTLTKHLPAASGIGGGSSDAAAALRGMLMREGDLSPDFVTPELGASILELGADVPMCLLPRPARVGGIGERIAHVVLPPLFAILVNPRVPVPTVRVFAALETADNPPMPAPLPDFVDSDALIGFLSEQRNDLQAPAIALAPQIDDCLSVLSATPGCRLARMSGSGATCFALYDDADAAQAAGRAVRDSRPHWWVAGGVLGDQEDRAVPVPEAG